MTKSVTGLCQLSLRIFFFLSSKLGNVGSVFFEVSGELNFESVVETLVIKVPCPQRVTLLRMLLKFV